MTDRRLKKIKAQLSVSEEKAWWRDMTELVGEKDQPLAVIGPRLSANADDLRTLGKAIEHWKDAFPQDVTFGD